MLLIGTIALAVWLAVVWFANPDDFHRSKRRDLVRVRYRSPNRYY